MRRKTPDKHDFTNEERHNGNKMMADECCVQLYLLQWQYKAKQVFRHHSHQPHHLKDSVET